jgi:hypothetical protein
MGAQRAFRYLQLEPVERHAIIVADLTLLLAVWKPFSVLALSATTQASWSSLRNTMSTAKVRLPTHCLPAVAEILSQFLERLARSGEKGERLRWDRVADLGGLRDIYGVYYRGLSLDAAHPSPTALKR